MKFCVAQASWPKILYVWLQLQLAKPDACLAFSWALKWLLHDGVQKMMACQESTRCRGVRNKLRHWSKNRKAVDHKALGKQKGHALTSSFLSLSHSWTLLGLHTKATQRSCAFRNTEGPAITIFSYFRKHWSISASIYSNACCISLFFWWSLYSYIYISSPSNYYHCMNHWDDTKLLRHMTSQ